MSIFAEKYGASTLADTFRLRPGAEVRITAKGLHVEARLFLGWNGEGMKQVAMASGVTAEYALKSLENLIAGKFDRVLRQEPVEGAV